MRLRISLSFSFLSPWFQIAVWPLCFADHAGEDTSEWPRRSPHTQVGKNVCVWCNSWLRSEQANTDSSAVVNVRILIRSNRRSTRSWLILETGGHHSWENRAADSR